jgi:hypothetical protein
MPLPTVTISEDNATRHHERTSLALETSVENDFKVVIPYSASGITAAKVFSRYWWNNTMYCTGMLL